VFISLILASKLWDDDSYENVHFARTFPSFTMRELADMESTFLSLIGYSLRLSSQEFAKYYFILRTFANSKERTYQINAIPVETVMKLQRQGANAEENLRAMYADALYKTM
jgi:hypothetical protein